MSKKYWQEHNTSTISPWLIYAMPTIVFVLAYSITTVFAATIYMFPGGDSYLSSRTGTLIAQVLSEIGSPTYLALLYLPLLITPLSAWLTIRATIKIKNKITLPGFISYSTISTRTLALIAVVSTAFCMWKLHQMGALDFGVLSSGNYIEKTTRRLELLDNLGFVFFAFAYGINVIVPILAFTAFVTQGEKIADLILFTATFCIFVFIITATYSKAQILIYLILATVAFLLIRPKLRYMLAVVIVSVAAFVITGYAMQTKPVPVIAKETPSHVLPNSPATTVIAPISIPTIKNSYFISYINKLTGDSFHRMAAATPYYAAMFKDPAERCGIQGNAVRHLLGLSEPACVLPKKVFNSMYPEVDWAQGQQPAPASLSAYGELGFFWSLTVMILAGFFLGVLGSIGAIGRGPLYIGFTIASCGFAYYLTQVPLIASFTYPHGLFVFMIPIVILLAVSISAKGSNANHMASNSTH